MQSTSPASIRLFLILPLARLVGRHGPVGQYEAGRTGRCQVMDDMLHPGEVGVALGRDAVLPALVFGQPFAAPVGDIEGRVGQDEVGLEVGVTVGVEGVAVGDLALNAANGEVHLGQSPRRVVRLLAINRDVGPGALRCAATPRIVVRGGHCRCRIDGRG